MKKVKLVEGISSSVLGFGCAPILGSVDGKKAKRALECALSCGITHFDIARSYGYGEAERFVGTILKSRRSGITLASKFGIKANMKAKLLSPLKPVIRFALAKIKRSDVKHEKVPAENNLSQTADRFHYRIPLTAIEMRKSLEESLRALRTDYLDYFFVHEPLGKLIYIDELTEMADILKKEGKIRAWGLSYMRHQKPLHESYLANFDLLQFDNSPGAIGYETSIRERAAEPNIIFSPLRGGNGELKPKEKLVRLSEDFTKSVILCSMFNEEHIKSNALLF